VVNLKKGVVTKVLSFKSLTLALLVVATWFGILYVLENKMLPSPSRILISLESPQARLIHIWPSYG
jgi:hypothetical protein